MIKHKQQQVSQPSDESGFTIIESLVAIIVVAILLAAIAPTIVIATATRVQSKRVELATQAVRTFIDGVKTGAVTTPATTITLLQSTDATRSLADNLLTTGATGNMPVPTASTSLYCVTKDVNNNLTISPPNCTSNLFYIQAVKIIGAGSTPIDTTTGLPIDGYGLGIRVYRSDIDFTKTVNASDSSNNKRQNTFTGTLGNTQSPLVEMTTVIASKNTSFNALCQRLAIPPTNPVTSNTTCN
ncbi:hormogonium polysaccharide secretion pseudopilin HpsB [Nostoc sp. JL33]|uniref:hormogonium polysaccharide secretion pseudopilin HpsB n=1 Tax=Nostoc sp. JL33 TaxID=2815396 RepID=UPI0025D16838|nr:hormogonium polysaccharide secretion pseudopilin HpsB [Nostoc sp. JL33]MBN3868967.1 type II secretion system protein [Nostoc sp. JL33]